MPECQSLSKKRKKTPLEKDVFPKEVVEKEILEEYVVLKLVHL
jgi:hypothetical protein